MACRYWQGEVKALRRQLETEKQQAAAKEAELSAQADAKEAELTARQAEFAAKEGELAAALAAACAAESSARENEGSSEVARPGDIDAVEPEGPKEAEAAVAVTASPDVVEAVEDEAAKEARGASTSDAGGGDGGNSTPHTVVLDTAAASDAGTSVQVPVSYKQLLQEVAALRQRLHDSSFEVVAGMLLSCAELLASCFCYMFWAQLSQHRENV